MEELKPVKDPFSGKLILNNPLNKLHLSKQELYDLLNCEEMMAKDMY